MRNLCCWLKELEGGMPASLRSDDCMHHTWHISRVSDVPQQPNWYDCGVYAIMFARTLAERYDAMAFLAGRAASTTLTQKVTAMDPQALRLQYAAEMLRGRFY